jgi:hypothetical protein
MVGFSAGTGCDGPFTLPRSSNGPIQRRPHSSGRLRRSFRSSGGRMQRGPHFSGRLRRSFRSSGGRMQRGPHFSGRLRRSFRSSGGRMQRGSHFSGRLRRSFRSSGGRMQRGPHFSGRLRRSFRSSGGRMQRRPHSSGRLRRSPPLFRWSNAARVRMPAADFGAPSALPVVEFSAGPHASGRLRRSLRSPGGRIQRGSPFQRPTSALLPIFWWPNSAPAPMPAADFGAPSALPVVECSAGPIPAADSSAPSAFSVVEFSAPFGLPVVGFSAGPRPSGRLQRSLRPSSGRMQRKRDSERVPANKKSAESDHRIDLWPRETLHYTLNPTTRGLFFDIRWSESAQHVREIRYDAQR